MSFILANVEPGHYYVIEDNSVVAEITRRYRNDKYRYYPEYEYILTWTWNPAAPELFKALYEVHELYHFNNYPGYGAILRTPGDRQSYRNRFKQGRKTHA